MKYTKKPRIAPYHSVPNLIIIATPIESTEVNPKYCNIPEIVASAIPSPPGIMLTAPTNDAKLNTNVDKIKLRDCPNPTITRKSARHSKNHAKALKKDIKVIFLGFINCKNVACIVLMSLEYFPALFSSMEIILPEIFSDLMAAKNPINIKIRAIKMEIPDL